MTLTYSQEWRRRLRAPKHDDADVVVTGDEVIVHMDVPGLSSDNLEIELENDVLTVRGERSHPYGPERSARLAAGRACLRDVRALAAGPAGPRSRGGLGRPRGGRADDPHPEARDAQAAPRRDKAAGEAHQLEATTA